MSKPGAARVLVVDDSVVIRQVVSDALRGDPNIEVVGVAENGKVALEKIASLQPDVITLDLEMPELDGISTLRELRKRGSRVPVVVFSTLTERGASATLEALACGAADYLCKPSSQRNITTTIERIRAELIPKVHALHARVQAKTAPVKAPAPTLAQQNTSALGPVQVIVIAVSTGGPGALAELIPKLPAQLQQPVLIVQHMPPVFTRVLAERLSATSQLKVSEAKHQDRIEPGRVLIAPGDYHMRIAGGPREAWVTLDQQPAENGCRPAADPLFHSAADVFGATALGVVLTGLGRDGTRGATMIKRAGGQVLVQDEATSTVWGMPGSVVQAGMASRVLPLAQLARVLAELKGQRFAPATKTPASPARPNPAPARPAPAPNPGQPPGGPRKRT
jgi:two-component system chemotaxis response regulator CheB